MEKSKEPDTPEIKPQNARKCQRFRESPVRIRTTPYAIPASTAGVMPMRYEAKNTGIGPPSKGTRQVNTQINPPAAGPTRPKKSAVLAIVRRLFMRWRVVAGCNRTLWFDKDARRF